MLKYFIKLLRDAEQLYFCFICSVNSSSDIFNICRICFLTRFNRVGLFASIIILNYR